MTALVRLLGPLSIALVACGGVPFETTPLVVGPDAGDEASSSSSGGGSSSSSSGTAADAAGEVVDAPDSSSPPPALDAAPAVDAASDGEGARDGTPDAPALGPDGCALVVHSNGLGGTWTDCVPLGTYDRDQALRACLSDGAVACNSGQGSASTGAYYVECAVGLTDYPCWIYSGPGTGQVTDGTGSRPAEPSDPHWY